MLMQFGPRTIDLRQPRVMGILNVTPDSFFDGGNLYQDSVLNLDKALYTAEQMVAAGATFIDIGGESTRPGAAPVSTQQECDRVLPVVESLAGRIDAVISVDTSTPQVITETARLGAGLINDVRALTRDGALNAAVESGLPVCLMHMQGTPDTMQQNPEYHDVVETVSAFLNNRASQFLHAGGQLQRIIVDPGFGFGKTDRHNLALLKSLPAITQLGYPVLVGLSRKSMIGRLLAREPDQRLPASLALALVALQNGAGILRVHDVAATIDVVKIFELMGPNAA